MLSKRGRILYVPMSVLVRLEEIKVRNNLKKNKPAWEKLAFLSGVGLNVEDNITIPSLFGSNKRGRKK